MKRKIELTVFNSKFPLKIQSFTVMKIDYPYVRGNSLILRVEPVMSEFRQRSVRQLRIWVVGFNSFIFLVRLSKAQVGL